jgi:hypothetical protein
VRHLRRQLAARERAQDWGEAWLAAPNGVRRRRLVCGGPATQSRPIEASQALLLWTGISLMANCVARM